MQTYDLAALSEQSHVRLTIDGAEPLSEALIQRTIDVCRRVERAEDEQMVILDLGSVSGATGAGGRPAVPSGGLVGDWERALRRLERVEVAIVAMVSGVCAGPATEAMLVADLRVAHDDATFAFGRDAEIWPGMAVYRLVAEVGGAHARRILLSDHDLAASEAAAVGIVDMVVDRVDTAAVEAAVKRLHTVPGADLAVMRRIVLDAHSQAFEDALGSHLAACDRMLRRI